MQEDSRRDGQVGTTGRRTFLAATGLAAASMVGLAGCLGDSRTSDPVAGEDPMETAVSGEVLSWDDLGDLEGTVTIYSGRTSDQIEPVFDALEDEYDDLTVQVDWGGNDDQVNQLIEEGDSPQADLMYSQDPGALAALHDEGLLQELPEDVVDAVPEIYREPDGYWTGVTGRVRSVMYNNERLVEETAFESGDDLPTDILDYATDERLQGIISTRPNSGTFRGFIQAMVERKGEDVTRDWVSDMVEKQDIEPFTSGSDQAEAINRGGDDDPIVALGNSYYAARILNEDSDAPIRVTFTEGDAGSLFSIAGIGITQQTGDPELVGEFIRHLFAKEGQEFMMEANGEYPVVEGIDYVGDLPDLEELNPPTFDISQFDMELQDAADLIVDAGMEV